MGRDITIDLKVGDIIEYIPKGAPRMDNSHLIPIKCEVLAIDGLFYKLSNGMAYHSKRFYELIQSVNGIIYKNSDTKIYYIKKERN